MLGRSSSTRITLLQAASGRSQPHTSPPVIPDEGEWHVRGGKLVLDFRGDAHDPKRSELVFTVRDDDHIVLRQPSGLETMLERLK